MKALIMASDLDGLLPGSETGIVKLFEVFSDSRLKRAIINFKQNKKLCSLEE